MQYPELIVGAILAAGVLGLLCDCVGRGGRKPPFLLPRAVDAFRRSRDPKTLLCPETGKFVWASLDTRYAARTAMLGSPTLRVVQCTLWPEQQACRQACLQEPRNQAILHTPYQPRVVRGLR
jgi:hypothetical protein